MTLKQVVTKLNQENKLNNFKTSLLAAKRQRQTDGDWIVVSFINRNPWCDFSSYRIELFEALPVGWPLSNVAERLNCSVNSLKIVAKYNALKKRWE